MSILVIWSVENQQKIVDVAKQEKIKEEIVSCKNWKYQHQSIMQSKLSQEVRQI